MNSRSKRPTPADLASANSKQLTVDESDALYYRWLHHRAKAYTVHPKTARGPQA